MTLNGNGQRILQWNERKCIEKCCLPKISIRSNSEILPAVTFTCIPIGNCHTSIVSYISNCYYQKPKWNIITNIDTILCDYNRFTLFVCLISREDVFDTVQVTGHQITHTFDALRCLLFDIHHIKQYNCFNFVYRFLCSFDTTKWLILIILFISKAAKSVWRKAFYCKK